MPRVEDGIHVHAALGHPGDGPVEPVGLQECRSAAWCGRRSTAGCRTAPSPIRRCSRFVWARTSRPIGPSWRAACRWLKPAVPLGEVEGPQAERDDQHSDNPSDLVSAHPARRDEDRGEPEHEERPAWQKKPQVTPRLEHEIRAVLTPRGPGRRDQSPRRRRGRRPARAAAPARRSRPCRGAQSGFAFRQTTRDTA